ncbi:MAG TPA: hypothetical protein VMJ10_21435 [Kofleriaceae bacterium]|nr:hypothetical protein [Kofleriaceae bacterium]
MRFAVLSAVLAACAPHAAHPVIPNQYACGDLAIVRDARGIAPAGSTGTTRLGYSDDDGDHYVSWPVSPIAVEAVELVVPADPRQDAVRSVYDTSKGSSRADWRLVTRQICTAQGGYSEALARYARGAALDAVGRDSVHRALIALEHRYIQDR